ncbi:protein S100-A12-like [Liasis olivaceus]
MDPIKAGTTARILNPSGAKLALFSIDAGDQKHSTMSHTQLEKDLESIVDIYHKYSIQQEHYDRLSKREVSRLLKEQLPNFLKSKKNPDAIDRIFKELDQNKDGEVSFEESMALIVQVLIYTHDKIHHGH